MPTASQLNKENDVKSVRKAKPAPDFSKLHKKWDHKLQKGKAVAKKPLTDVRPFALTASNTSRSNTSTFDDSHFESDPAEKLKILNSNVVNENKVRTQRATIAGISRASMRSPSLRTSFNAPQRSSLYTKSVSQPKAKQNVVFSPGAGKSRIPVAKPAIISESPAVKKSSIFQGFSVDFQPNQASLSSILNCEGISYNTPSKLSSQFGPSKKNRVKGRIVPFQKTPATSRASLNTRVVAEDPTIVKKQRWSIYSRDSFSTKPDLMTWLKTLMDKPVPGKTPKGNAVALSTATSSSMLSVTSSSTTSKVTTDGTSTQESLAFSRTLVGYQGGVSEGLSSSFKMTENVKDVNAIGQPSTNRPVPTPSTSNVKSILKKKENLSVSEKNEKTPMKTKQNTLLANRTPIRLSAYARNLRMLGMPLPKENRYERPGESITGPANVDNEDSEQNLSQVSANNNSSAIHIATPSTIKRVRWADDLNKSSETVMLHPPTSRLSPVLTKSSSPSVHQIKYVLPAEQPLEKMIDTQQSVSSSTSERMTNGWLPISSFAPSVFSTSTAHTSLQISSLSSSLHSTLSLSTVSDKCNDTSHCAKRQNSPVKKKESWASVLNRELTTEKDSSKEKVSRSLNEKFDATSSRMESLLKSKNETETETGSKKKPRKNKNKKRISILERIYGDAITFVDDEEENVDESSEQESVTTAQESFHLNESVRPLPSIDETVLNDLMKFDDGEETMSSTLMWCDDVFANNRLQSTLITTPSMIENEILVPLDATTPLNGTLTREQEDSSKKVPVAPSKKVKARARTPYKQAMLDYLEKHLVRAKQTDDTLNCTVGAQTEDVTVSKDIAESEVVENKEQLKSIFSPLENPSECNKSLLKPRLVHGVPFLTEQKDRESVLDIVLSADRIENERKPRNGLAVSKNDNSTALLTRQTPLITRPPIIREKEHSPVNPNSLMIMERQITPQATPSTNNGIAVTYSNHTTSVVNILSPSMRKFPSQSATVYSHFGSKPSTLFSNTQSCSTLEDRSSNQSFIKPARLLLSSGSFNVGDDAATSTTPYLDLRPALLPPGNKTLNSSVWSSKFNSPGNDLANDIVFPNQTVDESSVFEEDTDVCLVFPKHVASIQPNHSQNKETMNKQLSRTEQPVIPPTDNINIGANSAFRRVAPVCNMVPRLPTSVSIVTKSESIRAIEKVQVSFEKEPRTRISVLDAEVSLYSKFGEISEKFNKKVHHRREGATCALSKLLTVGDDMHFVPVESIGQ